jgi:hypothetical protein
MNQEVLRVSDTLHRLCKSRRLLGASSGVPFLLNGEVFSRTAFFDQNRSPQLPFLCCQRATGVTYFPIVIVPGMDRQGDVPEVS